MTIDPEKAEQVLTRHFAGYPAAGGGRVVAIFLWTLDLEAISPDESLDLVVSYIDRGGTRVRERNPRWLPSITTRDLVRLMEAKPISA